MRFQILSHAGLLIENNHTSLICDPWLLGSCYWRSWWNYPPVSKELVDSLNPEFIYLTHIHWDHFQGDSLRKLGKDKKIIVPKGNYDRIKRDLNQMGFQHVIELKHGESLQLAEKFKITSYQFGVFLDSAVVIEVDDQVLLNLNDCKHMGPTLQQIIKKHPVIDFVFRSHSTANSRLCYEITDEPAVPVDDLEQYIQNFAYTVRATGARYAIPFASNHCHLHPEVMHFNNLVQTPRSVEQYFATHHITAPQVKVMVSGDSFDSVTGFHIVGYDWFAKRDLELQKYYEEKLPILQAQADKEAKIGINLARMQSYFSKFSKAIPWVIRRKFKGHPIVYVLQQGDKISLYEVNITSGSVKALDTYNDVTHPIQIHTNAFLMRQCVSADLFSHLAISKRVRYRTPKKLVKYIRLLNLLFNFYEYDMLPLRKLLQGRFWQTWLLRWRELWLYTQLLKDKIIYRKLDFTKYLPIRNCLDEST